LSAPQLDDAGECSLCVDNRETSGTSDLREEHRIESWRELIMVYPTSFNELILHFDSGLALPDAKRTIQFPESHHWP
jgi:hypothetical protein